MPWARRASKPIPALHSRDQDYEFNDYSWGMNSFLGNDKFPINNQGTNMWRLSQNARVNTLGGYDTRKGFDFHSAAVGEAIDVQQTSTTGAADQNFSQTTRIAKKITFTTTGRCTRLDINLKNSASATGTIIVELWSSAAGAPSVKLGRTSIAASDLAATYDYEIARLPSAPSVTATDYWCVVYVQSTGSGSYKISTTTNASTGLTSTNSGSSWSAANVDFNVKAYLSTTGGSKGLFRGYKSDGTAVTLLAHGTTVSKVNNSTGALTTIKSGLSSSATDYRFVLVNDVIYYINGFDGLRKWDFTNESQVSSTNYTNLIVHKGLLFLVTKDDQNKIVFSNFADYETFTSTDFIYSPSPKSSPVTALCSLNGYMLIRTANGNQILSGEDNATFRLDDAPDQKGTFTQETTANDKNFQYFASDDGVYKSNGTSPVLISENIYNDYRDISSKDQIVMTINKGRLYMWYPSEGSAANDRCFVWNLNYSSGEKDMVESQDTGAYVGRAYSAYDDDDDLLVASSLVGQVYWQEKTANDFTNLGDDIEFLLQTHYSPFKAPAVEKEIRYWKARLEAQSAAYSIACEYAYDMRDNWQSFTDLDVQGSGYEWGDSGTVWGTFTWGTTAETQANMYVPGSYRRIAVRYKHYAARQPHSFLGHTFVAQTRRLR